jgi:LacI family transcriptional regulator
MLKGIAHFERTHHTWTAFHDDQAISVVDPQWIRGKKWQGIISRHTTPLLAQTCLELGIPLVDLNDVEPFPGIPKIRPDNVGIGHLGAEHFIERGYQKFGFCGFANNLWSRERRDGFVEADLPKPIGVMACVDLRAQQLVSAAVGAGVLVPEEVAILGANNDTIRCELSDPALSSVAPNAFQSGYRAAALLRDLLAGKKPKVMEQRVEPLGVVTRHSTDILAVEDRNVAAALSFIREQACRGITVDQVLQHAHASRSQMERKFRQHIGRSPQSEIRRVQLRKIRQLLLETDFPLKRIAELTGFEHMEYMCVLFKRMTGSSPGIYRVKMQDKAVVGAPAHPA